MEHHSILYGPVNRLLTRLLGEPPVDRMSPGAAAFWFPDGKQAWIPDPALMAILVLLLLAVVMPAVARKYNREKPGSVQNFLELLVDGIRSLVVDVIGHDADKKYLWMVGALGVFIGISNLFGMLFFLTPPTAAFSTTLALAVVSFFYFNWQGIREQGFLRYLRHFAGPSLVEEHASLTVKIATFPVVFAFGLLFFVIEWIGNFARVLSLSVRLFMNIFGEHTVTGFFAGIAPILVPWPLMVLGLFTAFLQAFIFVILTAVYIALVTATEEH
jgi:F-type H+-transporting ATPase subunit a